MKVLMVAPYFHPRVGGVESYTFNLAKGLAALGWQVVIVTSGAAAARATAPDDEDGPAGLRIYRLPAALRISNTPIGFRWRRRLREIYRTERPDVINGHTPVPYLADVAERARNTTP